MQIFQQQMAAETESPKVFVGNLSFDTTADELRQLFESFKVYVQFLYYNTNKLTFQYSTDASIITRRVFPRRNKGEEEGEEQQEQQPVKPIRRSKGFGFVAFASLSDAEKAVQKFNNTDFKGRTIKIEIAKPQEPRDEENGEKKPRSRPVRKPAAEGEKASLTITTKIKLIIILC